MNLDFWVGFFTGAVTLVLMIFVLEGVSEHIQKKRRKIKDEWE